MDLGASRWQALRTVLLPMLAPAIWSSLMVAFAIFAIRRKRKIADVFDFAAPLPTDQVRFTSVYSKGDGIVHWPGSVIAGADCVEVTGSHVGLVFNRKAYRAIADALARPEIT